MIPIQVSASVIKARDKNGNWKEISMGSANFGVNIDDGGNGSTTTWSSSKINQLITQLQQENSNLSDSIASTKKELSDNINKTNKDLDDKIENSKIYLVYIESTNGRYLPEGVNQGDYVSTLKATVFLANEDVTDKFDDSHFTWTRESADRVGDRSWNNIHNACTKNLKITYQDLYQNGDTDFSCCFDPGEEAIVAYLI